MVVHILFDFPNHSLPNFLFFFLRKTMSSAQFWYLIEAQTQTLGPQLPRVTMFAMLFIAIQLDSRLFYDWRAIAAQTVRVNIG